MKVLTAAQMREVDRRTIELGILGIILMENAGNRVVEFLAEKFSPLARHRISVLCGKGNNGGDGLVVARQLHTRFRPRALHVVLAGRPEDLKGDAAANFKMLRAAGCEVQFEIAPDMRRATLVIDAVLGTGLTGPARDRSAELIREINSGFPEAKVLAVDLPSGLASDSAFYTGDVVRADFTVTFTAPKPCHVISPACDRVGELRVCQIGSPEMLYEQDDSVYLSLSEPAAFQYLLKPRVRDSNKGLYGHALIIAGGRGKTGAAAMAGIGALRAGAGLVTVASAASAIDTIAAHAPELMTDPLPETVSGMVKDVPSESLHRKNVVAIGPGMGSDPETVQLIRRLVGELETTMVVDADGLNAIAGQPIRAKGPRILTPHPGEMARLTGLSVEDVQADRIGVARSFAQDKGVHLVLKGNRTLMAWPNGRVWINPTGSPAMATGGTGDVLTGILAGLLAQFPQDVEAAVLAGVYLHGRAGEIGARELGEKSLIAGDLFRFLPEAIRECAEVLHAL